MYTAKEIRNEVDMNLTVVNVKALLGEEQVIRKINNVGYYSKDTLKRFKENYKAISDVNKKVKHIFNHYARPHTASEPSLYIQAGISYYLNDKGYSIKSIGVALDKSRTAIHHALSQRESYNKDIIARMIIEDVYSYCKVVFNDSVVI